MEAPLQHRAMQQNFKRGIQELARKVPGVELQLLQPGDHRPRVAAVNEDFRETVRLAAMSTPTT